MNRHKLSGLSAADMRQHLAQADAIEADVEHAGGDREAMLEQLFASCGVVYAVWPKRVMPSVLGHALAMPAGRRLMTACVLANVPLTTRTATVRVASFREAQALCQRYGDERPVH